MEDDLGYVQQVLAGLEQYFSCLANGVKYLRREEEAILDKHNSYDCYESNRVRARDCYYDISCKGVPRNDIRNGGNYVNKDERFHKRRDNFGEYYDSYYYGGYNYARSSQALGTTSRPISYNKFKLPLLCGTFGPYDYEACKQKVESLFYSFCVREEEKFKLLLKSLSYEVNVWWD
ncbi:hypothetical protein M9H77_23865 [Catharanthus roseus]|uniref:Uncharacterized protein n=1 Tax=Catharanthus roseus TaxID=4058 RepID=A0ACC0AU49_CATRO|nr:hypothetical protein M9H77_23865 [Catharanthus roseus]